MRVGHHSLALWLLVLAPSAGCQRCSPSSSHAPSAAALPTIATLETAFAKAPTLAIAEQIKCLRLRRALAAVGIAKTPALPADCRAGPLDLAPDEAVISFFAHGGKLHRFVAVGRRPPRALSALPLAVVEPLVIKARDELELGGLEDDDVTGLFSLLARTHELLLGGTKQLLAGARHLTVIPDGLLKVLPLHVLRRADGAFLTRGTTLSTLPCLALRRPPPTAPKQARFYAPGYGDRRAAIAGALAETREALKSFGEATLLSGDDVSRGRLLMALGHRRAVVHFAGHGLPLAGPTGEPPGPSELVLGGGRTLTARDLARGAPLAAPLVLLASCAGAYPARFRNGQRKLSPVSLVEVLLAQGIGAVIASSWAVKDSESARQMRLLYRSLKQQGPAAALAAVYAARQRGIRPAHPRYWGAYTLYGAHRWRRR